MLARRLPWLALAVAVACLSMPGPAEAQLRGFIKRKIGEKAIGKVVGKDSAASASAPKESAAAGPHFDDVVLEMTSPTLDKFQTGLMAEKAYRDSVQATYARMMTRDQYEQCKAKAMTSPEVQNLVHNADYSSAQAAQETGQKMMAMLARHCGPDPSTMDRSRDLRKAGEHGAEVAGLTQEQYAVLLERVTPFCGEGGGTAKIQGSGSGIFYVYSEAEIAALQPRCQKLMALLPSTTTGGRRTK